MIWWNQYEEFNKVTLKRKSIKERTATYGITNLEASRNKNMYNNTTLCLTKVLLRAQPCDVMWVSWCTFTSHIFLAGYIFWLQYQCDFVPHQPSWIFPLRVAHAAPKTSMELGVKWLKPVHKNWIKNAPHYNIWDILLHILFIFAFHYHGDVLVYDPGEEKLISL